MRTLSITRNKSFVGCAGRMKVYIEDAAGDLYINDVLCRQLGTLKNGETASFPIGDEAVRLFVIADKMSRGYCQDCYPIPEGLDGDTVTVSGKNTYNPGAGNPFRFDGVTDETILATRKKNGRRGVLIIVGAVVLGIVIGLLRVLPDLPKTFSPVDGMKITLTLDFDEYTVEGYDFFYSDDYLVVNGFLDGDFTADELAATSVQDYIPLFTAANDWMKGASIHEKDGFTYYQYAEADGDDTYVYMGFFFKTAEGFWVVEFWTHEDNTKIIDKDIFRYAKSITFAEN